MRTLLIWFNCALSISHSCRQAVSKPLTNFTTKYSQMKIIEYSTASHANLILTSHYNVTVMLIVRNSLLVVEHHLWTTTCAWTHLLHFTYLFTSLILYHTNKQTNHFLTIQNNIRDKQYLIMNTIAAPISSIKKKQIANRIANITRTVVSKIKIQIICTHYNVPL